MGLPSMAPAISDTCFIAPSANVVGNVKVLAYPLMSLRLSFRSERFKGNHMQIEYVELG